MEEREMSKTALRLPRDLHDWAKRHGQETYSSVSRVLIVALDNYRRQVEEDKKRPAGI